MRRCGGAALPCTATSACQRGTVRTPPDGGCQLVECCREQFLTDGFESQPETRQLRRHWANLRGERRPRVVLRCVGAHVSESSLAAVCMYVPVFVDPGGLRLIH